MRAGWWWIDRWRKSTAYTDMTLAEQGAYRNLLDELWLRKGLLPTDDRILGKIAGDVTEWPAVRDVVMARFYTTPDGWRNVTHDEVMAGTLRHLESQRVKGRKRATSAQRGPNGTFQPNQPRNQPETSRTDETASSPTSRMASHDTSRASSLPSPSPKGKTGMAGGASLPLFAAELELGARRKEGRFEWMKRQHDGAMMYRDILNPGEWREA